MREVPIPLDVDTGSVPPSRRRKAFKVLAVVILALLLLLWFFPSPRTTDQPVTYNRDADGNFIADSDVSGSGLDIAVEAASLESRNSISSASSSTHSGADFFASESVTVINQSDSLLMKRAADRLVEELKDKGNFQSVSHLPAGNWPKQGTRKSDLYLMMQLCSIQESGIATSSLEADILITFCPRLVASNNSYVGSYRPPALEFRVSMEVDHRSTLKGVESAGAKFRLQGNNIGEAIAEKVLEDLRKRREEERAMPQLPQAFYPEWEPAPEFAFLADHQAECRLSVSGCCRINDTLWFVPGCESRESLFLQIQEELQADDWRGESRTSSAIHLRMTKRTQVVEVFPDRTCGFESQDADSRTFWIRYVRDLDKDEMNSLYGELLLTEPPDTDLLLSLQQLANHQQREKVLDLVEANPPSRPDAWLSLAGRYFARNEREKGVAALQCVWLLGRIDQSDVGGQIRNMIRKQDVERSDVERISRSSLENLGIPILTPDQTRLEIPVRPAQIMAVAVPTDDQQLEVCGLLLKPERTDDDGSMAYVSFRTSGWSTSWSSGNNFREGSWEREHRINGRLIRIFSDRNVPGRLQVEVRGGSGL